MNLNSIHLNVEHLTSNLEVFNSESLEDNLYKCLNKKIAKLTISRYFYHRPSLTGTKVCFKFLYLWLKFVAT